MKILIVEDEKSLAESIRMYLTNEGYHCDVAYSLESGEEKIAAMSYNCILLDINLPDGSGFALLKRLRGYDNMSGVIMISERNSVNEPVNGLAEGADDFVTRPFHLSELNARITSVIRKREINATNTLTFKELSIDTYSQIVTVNDMQVMLTRKEYDLLVFLLSNKGRVISKGAIAEHLSGGMADMLDNFGFIYAHMKNLKKKLFESGCKDYVRTVYKFGYQWIS